MNFEGRWLTNLGEIQRRGEARATGGKRGRGKEEEDEDEANIRMEEGQTEEIINLRMYNQG